MSNSSKSKSNSSNIEINVQDYLILNKKLIGSGNIIKFQRYNTTNVCKLILNKLIKLS